MGLIMSKGHSRIPVYSGDKGNIIGFILVSNSEISNWPTNRGLCMKILNEMILYIVTKALNFVK